MPREAATREALGRAGARADELVDFPLDSSWPLSVEAASHLDRAAASITSRQQGADISRWPLTVERFGCLASLPRYGIGGVGLWLCL